MPTVPKPAVRWLNICWAWHCLGRWLSLIHIFVGPHGQQLVQRQPAALEAQGRARQVQAVGTHRGFVGEGTCAVELALQSVRPGPQRAGVMGSQVLGVDEFESAARQGLDGAGHVHQLATGEDVPFDEVTHAGTEPVVLDAAGGDRMIQQQATGPQQPPQAVKVAPHLRLPDMLEHAHRGDAVELARPLQIPVVEQAHLDLVTQSCRFDQAADMLMLVARQRDAQAAHTMVLRRPHQQLSLIHI